MIRQLTMKNFRKVTEGVMHFTPGLNVIRGANEASKSTRLEAMAYALFGIAACRDPLERVVTWGQPDRTLKVELVFEHDGTTYTIARSKSGAEINYAGGKVTGQKECSAFIERLLGVNATTVSRLMLSTQGAIRGALEQGSKATMELIEQLADFDQIDQVVELITSTLVTGHVGPTESKVAMLVEKAEALQVGVTEPDVPAYEAAKAGFQMAIGGTQREIDATWKPAHDAAQAAVNAAQAAKQTRYSLSQNLERMRVNLQLAQQVRVDALAKATPVPEVDIKAAELAVEAAKQHAAVAAAHRWMTKLMATYPEECWDDTPLSLEKEVSTAAAQLAAAQLEVAGVNGEIRVLAAQPSKGTNCQACGQALPDAAAIAKHQAERDAKLAAAQGRLPALQVAVQTASEYHKALSAVLKSADPFNAAARDLAEYVIVNSSTVPPRLTWKGPAPAASPDVPALEANLANLRRAARAAADAAAKAEAQIAVITQFETQITETEQKIAELGDADNLPALREALEKADAGFLECTTKVNEAKAALAVLEQNHAVAMATYQGIRQQQQAADNAVAVAKEELRQLAWNNALLKAVRAARPTIADKLWTVVLASVSSYFSTMRGETSAVIREGNEFKVNGNVIGGGGLSGSALDILGLAIRMALTRTFLPSAPFMILDEPAAAMDVNRTRQTLGFLVAAGFKQTILVTHEDESEAVADNLITI